MKLAKGKKNILLVAVLALAGIFSFSVNVIEHDSNEHKIYQRVEASKDYSDSSFIYLDAGAWASDSAKYKIEVKGWGDGWSSSVWGPLSSSPEYGNVYKVYLKSYGGAKAICITRRNPTTDDQWNYIDVDESNMPSSGQWMKVTASGNNNYSGPANTTTVTVKEVDSNGTELGEKEFTIGDGQALDVTYFDDSLDTFYGLSFDAYYTSKSFNTSVSSVNSSTTIYAKYNSVSTKTVYFDAGSMHDTYSAPYFYCFDSHGKINASYPGEAMVKRSNSQLSIYGGYVWEATIPEDGTVIFNPNTYGNPDYGKTDSLSDLVDGETYLIYSLGVGNWYSDVTVTFTNQETSTTTNYYAYTNGVTPISFGTPSLSKTGYTGTWNTRTDGSGTSYNQSAIIDGFNSDTHLYSKFTINSYTVTYHRNDEHTTNNSYTTDSINYGGSHTVLSISSATLGSWGSSYLRTFLRWHTTSDGTSGTDYAPGDSLTIPDGNVDLYSIQAWHTFQCSADGLVWTNLNISGETPENYLIQFELSSDITLTENDTLRFRYKPYGGLTWTNIDNDKIDFSGNYGENGVSISASAKIYLKVPTSYTEGEFECYVAGLSDLTAVVTHNGVKTYYGGVDGGYDSDGHKQFNISGYIYIQAGDTLQADYLGSNLHNLYLDNTGAGFDRGDYPSETATCTVTGAYQVYIKNYDNTGYNWNNVYVSRDEEESAVYFARMFDTAMGAICQNDGSTNWSSLLLGWWGQEDPHIDGGCLIYSQLSNATKAYLTDESENEYIEIFIKKYDYILSKYGYTSSSSETTKLYDFLGRTPAKSAIRNFTIDNIFGSEDSVSIIIIIIASSVALLSVTALSILVIKKKRREEYR